MPSLTLGPQSGLVSLLALPKGTHRGLAGRLVCGRCARPLGRAEPFRRRRTRVNPNRLSLGMALEALVSLGALLAVWDLQRSRGEAPLDRSRPADALPAL